MDNLFFFSGEIRCQVTSFIRFENFAKANAEVISSFREWFRNGQSSVEVIGGREIGTFI